MEPPHEGGRAPRAARSAARRRHGARGIRRGDRPKDRGRAERRAAAPGRGRREAPERSTPAPHPERAHVCPARTSSARPDHDGGRPGQHATLGRGLWRRRRPRLSPKAVPGLRALRRRGSRRDGNGTGPCEKGPRAHGRRDRRDLTRRNGQPVLHRASGAVLMTAATNPSRILLVEDDENDVLFLERAFDKAGAPRPFRVLGDGQETIAYLSGADGFENRSEHPLPSHLILDLKIPRKNGFEVLEWVRNDPRWKDLPVVALTSSGDQGDRDRARALGVDGYFVKPSRHPALVEIVKQIVSLWALGERSPGSGGPVSPVEEPLTAEAPAAGPPAGLLELFPGDGEMASLMRQLEWSRTPVGPIATWPENLRTAVRICVTSTLPMWVWWGPEYTQFYNDAYRPILGNKHPLWLGHSGKECWMDIWNQVGPMLEGVRSTGRATGYHDLQVVMDRYLPQEETYLTLSFSPILGRGSNVDGLFCICGETTSRVVSQRRLQTLRDLAAGTARESDEAEACKAAAAILANNALDVPFALIYLAEPDGASTRLAAASGIDAGTADAPLAIQASNGAAAPWPLAAVSREGRTRHLSSIRTSAPLPGGPWPEPARDAFIL